MRRAWATIYRHSRTTRTVNILFAFFWHWQALLSSDEHRPRRIGIVGLGAGTLAVYGRRGDAMRFYEINLDVISLARKHFTFLDDSAAKIDILPGDARLVLEREPDQNFDVLVLDAFSSDAIPVHLLTSEAMQIYMRHVNSDGIPDIASLVRPRPEAALGEVVCRTVLDTCDCCKASGD